MDNEEFFEIEENDEESKEKKSLGALTNSYISDKSQENSKTYIRSKIEKEQIKDLSNNSLYNSNSNNNIRNNLLESEEIFINQKEEIKRTREKNLILLKKKNKKKKNIINDIEKNESRKDNINNSKEKIENENDTNESNSKELLIFTLNDSQFFEIAIFDYMESYDEEKQLIPEFNKDWKPLDELLKYYAKKNKNSENQPQYIEFTRIAMRSIKEIDYGKKGLELSIKFNLKGESELWIFTRCSVNKSINESYYFDDKSANVDINDIFNKYSSVIRIIKVRNSNKCFVIFGTFCQEINTNKLYYKSFLKRQIIDNSEIERNENEFYYFGENDKCEFEIYITDYGEEFINTKIYLNNQIKFNDISAKFFLPINKKAKFLICGSGKSVQIKDLTAKIFDKENSNFKSIIQFEYDNDTPKNCECCSIW